MLKRTFDFFSALFGLLLLSPLFLIICIMIKKDASGPVFFRQERVGYKGKYFKIFKFRTMISDAEKKGVQITSGDDSRVTKIGKFLRKTKLDELPQLINVLFGEMSLVGPRPEVPKYVAFYPADLKELILSVRPGITDIASIEFKDEASLLSESSDPEIVYINDILPVKLRYCLYYIENKSILLDIKIIFRTIIAII